MSPATPVRTAALPLVCLLAMTAPMLAGCAAAPKATAYPQDVLLGRQMFDTEYAFIYASSPAAASEVAGDLAAAAQELQKTLKDHPAKGLIIVSDKQDLPYTTDRMLVCRMITQEEAARAANPADVKPVTQEQLTKAGQKVGPELLHRVLLARCGSIEPAEAVRIFGLANRPAATAGWVITAPTSAFVQQVAREILAKAMSQPDVPLMAKLLIAPLGPLFEAKAGQQTGMNRQIALYAALVQHDLQLDETSRRRLACEFHDRKLGAEQKNSALLSALQEMQKKAAATTQTAATQAGQ